MVCWHRDYDLGDEHQHSDPQEFLKWLAIRVDPTVEDRIEYWENGPGLVRCANTGVKEYWTLSDKRVRDIVNKAINKHVVMLPLYLYDHSGITMSTSAFSRPWDSGQVGFIYITRAKIQEEYGWKVVTSARRKLLEKHLTGDVEVYDNYLTGAIYGFQVFDETGEEIDSCGGFSGYDHERSGMLMEIQQCLDEGYTLEDA